MTSILIQPVQHDELEMLAEIGRKTFIETFADGNNPDDLTDYIRRAFSIDRLRAEMQNSGSSFYFAKTDNEIAGYLKLNVGIAQTENIEGHTLEIERIYVTARTQGAGIGKALFDFALDIAKQAQAEALWLGVWEANPKAIKFYERQGFIPFGEHEFRIGKDIQRDILMRLDLR